MANNEYENSEFKSNLDLSRLETIKKLRDKFNYAKFEVVKEYLRKSEISFDDDCTDLKDLRTLLKRTLGEIEYENALNIIDQVDENFDELLDDLVNGSATAFTKFIDKCSKMTNVLSKATLHSLASRTAIILAPTVSSKVLVGAALTARSLYKLNKSKKQGTIVDVEYECNKILQELELTRDENGKILDTRFNPSIQQLIRNFLSDKKVSFDDFGYLSLREQIYKLSAENKKELCHIINNNTGNKIDVNRRIEKVKGSFFDTFKSKVKSIGTSTLAGIGTAGVINSVDPAIVAAPLNSIATSGVADEYIISKLISDESSQKIANFLTTVAGTTAGALAENLPVIGEYVENFYALENLVVGGIAGLGAGVIGTAASSVIGVVSGLCHKFGEQKDRKDILEYDSKKYLADNMAEISQMQAAIASKESSLEEQVIIDLGYGFLCESGIKLDAKPKNIYELKKVISSLDASEKKAISKFFDKLEDYNKNEHGDFVNSLIKAKNVVSTLALVGLSGLSVYDLLKDGEFLPELSAEIFKDVPGNIYLQLPEKIQIDRIEREGLTDSISQFGENVSDNFDAVISGEKGVGEAVSDVFDGSSEVSTSSDDLVRQFCSIEDVESTKRIYDYLEGMQVEEKTEFLGFEISSKMVPNKERITTFIEGLQQDNLIDLAYYYNSCPDIDKSTDVSLAIGEVLKDNLSTIQEGIEAYNQQMDVINMVSKGVSNVVPVIDGVSEVAYKVNQKK